MAVVLFFPHGPAFYPLGQTAISAKNSLCIFDKKI